MAERLRLLHVCPWVRTIGGVETLLARHASADAASGFDAWQLALFDRSPARAGESYSTQAFSWRSTPRRMRQAISAALSARVGSVVLWHNAWGLPWFGDLDGSTRRIVCLWDSETHFGPWLSGLAGLVDGAVCISDEAARAVARLLPHLKPERIAVLPVPIAVPPGVTIARSRQSEWVIGCAGRLVRAQKRWDRLVPFVTELRRMGVQFRLEIVSDGPLRRWLERSFSGDRAIQFLGWLDRAEYWRRLQTWDAAVFFSDHEGGPIVMLEGMAAGALPFYPAIGGSLGDDYAPRIDPRCHYAAGDPVAAARAVRDVLSAAPEAVAELRRRAQALTRRHDGGNYDRIFADFIRRIAELPRLSTEPRGDRPARLADWLPLGLITRAVPGALWR